jgi:hypothetical protein
MLNRDRTHSSLTEVFLSTLEASRRLALEQTVLRETRLLGFAGGRLA